MVEGSVVEGSNPPPSGLRPATSPLTGRIQSLAPARALALGAEADRLGQRAPLFSIIGCDHRIISGEAEALPILGGGVAMRCRQVTLEHFLPLSALEAGDV